MAKISRMEDIIEIVGLDHYIKAIQMPIEDLCYLGEEKVSSSKVTLKFCYQDDIFTGIDIGNDHFIKDIGCSCSIYNRKDYCPHAALVIMYLYQHEELVNRALDRVVNDYDHDFNSLLFRALSEKGKKEKVSFDIILKDQGDFCYELSLKVGLNKKYVLKKNIREFVEQYQDDEYVYEFGKHFTYCGNRYYFDEKDTLILKFLSQYFDSQVGVRYGYYGYYQPNNTTILLKNELLNSFFHLICDRRFRIEQGYYYQDYDGIVSSFPVQVFLRKINDGAELEIDYSKLECVTEDFSYVKNRDVIYHLNDEERFLLQFMMKYSRKKIVFQEGEFSDVSNQILPRLSNIQISDDLKDVFVQSDIGVKFYFEKEKRGIVGNIKLCFEDVEIDIFDSCNSFGGHYITRDILKEQSYIDELYHYGFTLCDEKYFLLSSDDKIVDFLEEGLVDLQKQHDVYVSRNLKNIQVWKKVHVQNSFGIGQDNIFSYQFDVSHVDRSEIVDLLQAVRLKKKYYKLKSGDYLNITDQDDLNKMDDMLRLLNIDDKDLKNEQIFLPKYKSIYVNDLVQSHGSDFISLNDMLRDMVDQFTHYRDQDICFPDGDLEVLRDYQVIGVQWMMMIARCGFGGILADEMGLGKSIQTICYMKLRLQENPKARFLIVVPTSLVYNWEHELHKFGPDIRYAILNDVKVHRKQLLNQIEDYQVFITSYGVLRQDIDEYQNIHFDTCIIDEAQNIKNVSTMVTRCVKMVNADVKFALTGTPIENTILELWSIFDFIMPGFLPNLTRFKQMYSVKNMEMDAHWYEELNRQIRPFILRRKKVDVLSDLPTKLENMVFVELSDEQKKIYLAQLEKTKKEIDESLAIDGYARSQILILSLLTKLRQVCIDPRLLIEDYHEISSKIENLLLILDELILNGHKILVFSQFPSALRLISPELDQRNISYYYLDGTTKSKDRMQMVDQFNSDDTKVFLISLKAGGTGLNLTSADVVIHLDPWWNPQVENQATDRSHRIGQKNVVNVIKMITKGTIEEKIVELQNKKRKLSDQLIDGEQRDEIVLSKLSESELKDILSSNF